MLIGPFSLSAWTLATHTGRLGQSSPSSGSARSIRSRLICFQASTAELFGDVDVQVVPFACSRFVLAKAAHSLGWCVGCFPTQRSSLSTSPTRLSLTSWLMSRLGGTWIISNQVTSTSFGRRLHARNILRPSVTVQMLCASQAQQALELQQ